MGRWSQREKGEEEQMTEKQVVAITLCRSKSSQDPSLSRTRHTHTAPCSASAGIPCLGSQRLPSSEPSWRSRNPWSGMSLRPGCFSTTISAVWTLARARGDADHIQRRGSRAVCSVHGGKEKIGRSFAIPKELVVKRLVPPPRFPDGRHYGILRRHTTSPSWGRSNCPSSSTHLERAREMRASRLCKRHILECVR